MSPSVRKKGKNMNGQKHEEWEAAIWGNLDGDRHSTGTAIISRIKPKEAGYKPAPRLLSVASSRPCMFLNTTDKLQAALSTLACLVRRSYNRADHSIGM
jgi:hypothetical protein